MLESAADGTPTVVSPRIELTLEWLVESPPPEHTWEEPPIVSLALTPGSQVISVAPRCSRVRSPMLWQFYDVIGEDDH